MGLHLKFRYAKSIITARHRLQCTTRNSVAVVRLDRNYASSVDNVNNTLFLFFCLRDIFGLGSSPPLFTYY